MLVQSTGQSDQFSAEPGKGRSVSDMMMQALADAMMSQMHGRVWNTKDKGAAAQATEATGANGATSATEASGSLETSASKSEPVSGSVSGGADGNGSGSGSASTDSSTSGPVGGAAHGDLGSGGPRT